MRMSWPAIAFVLSFGPAARAQSWSFESDRPGAPPRGFHFAHGAGTPGKWVVKAVDGAASGRHVLAQVDVSPTDTRSALALLDTGPVRDVIFSVKCRPEWGRIEQGCGIVFRYRDPMNHYLVQANAREGHVRLFRVKGGLRKQFAGWSGKIATGVWHDLRVEARGDRFVVTWNGQKAIEASDGTFPDAGRIGLWTKADSVTWFDDLRLQPAGTPPLDTARIEELTGQRGAWVEQEGVFRVRLPRTDLKVRAAGVKVTPRLGLTAWAAFQQAGDRVTVTGDLVLLEDQVNPVMSAALDAGLEVTALRNQFLWDAPKVMLLRIGGTGDEATLAGAVGKVFAKLKATAGGRGGVPRATIDPARSKLDTAKLVAVLGATGELEDGVYRIGLGRESWAAFAGSEAKAVVAGDVAVAEGELQSALKALRRAGILIVAIDRHTLRYWGVGRAEDLAKGVRAALDQTRR